MLSRPRAPRLHMLIEAMVLRRHMGDPAMMHGQLHHLLAIGARNNVTIQVLPFDAASTIATQGPLLILESKDHTLIYEETRTTSTFLEDEQYVSAARFAWRKLSAVAMSPEDSLKLIAHFADKMRSEIWAPSGLNGMRAAGNVNKAAACGVVGVRDSTNTEGPVLVIPAAGWTSFLRRHG